MDNAARTRQRVLAIFLPVTAVLYISAEACSSILSRPGQSQRGLSKPRSSLWPDYPQSQRPDITTGAVLRFLESVKGGP